MLRVLLIVLAPANLVLRAARANAEAACVV